MAQAKAEIYAALKKFMERQGTEHALEIVIGTGTRP